MPISDSLTHLPITEIIIDRDQRQRRKVEVDDIMQSIRKVGLIHPIIVRKEDDYKIVLVAGERRLMAYKKLGHTNIPVRFMSDLSQTEIKIVELEENIKRKDLSWQETLNAVISIHELHLSINSGWTQQDTANSISISRNTVFKYIKVHKHMGNPRISEADSLEAALNVVDRWQARKDDNAFGELLDISSAPINFEAPPPQHDTSTLVTVPTVKTEIKTDIVLATGTVAKTIADDILHTSFIEWAASYTGPKFNLIHIDFPWGIGNVEKQQRLGAEPTPYQDEYEDYIALLHALVDNFWKFTSMSSHIMFWHSIKTLPEAMNILSKIPIQWSPHPLIWVHSDQSGISPNPKRDPRHAYDTCLLGSLGGRSLIKIATDFYACPTDHKLHPSTKPEPMLKHFFSMLVDQYTSLLDPTCGSGSALRAAETLGAHSILGLESKWEFCEAARKALRDSRTLHLASSSI